MTVVGLRHEGCQSSTAHPWPHSKGPFTPAEVAAHCRPAEESFTIPQQLYKAVAGSLPPSSGHRASANVGGAVQWPCVSGTAFGC